MDLSHNCVICGTNSDGKCGRMPGESPKLKRTEEFQWPRRGQQRPVHTIWRLGRNCPGHRKISYPGAGRREWARGVGLGYAPEVFTQL